MSHLEQHQAESIAAYKSLPIKEQAAIAIALTKLRMKLINGQAPSPEEIISISQESGHRDIALGCYGAELIGVNWMK